MLRDAAAEISDRLLKKVTIIDERGEIAAVSGGVPQNNVGINTDVLDGYRKADGILQALRTLSPELIVCDEIGGEADLRAVEAGLNAGVAFAAAIHAGSREELLRKRDVTAMLKNGGFETVVFLQSGAPCVIAQALPCAALCA